MAHTFFSPLRAPAALALALLMGTTSAGLAQSAFDAPAPFSGMVRFSGQNGAPVYSGEAVSAEGGGFAAGQEVTVSRGKTTISPAGLKADAEGKFKFDFTVPADAATGLHPIVVTTESPDTAEVVELKVSPKIPFTGAEKFDITSKKAGRGLYQVAYSEKSKALFVTAAVGRPPVKESQLLKLDPATLDVLASITPAAAPAIAPPAGAAPPAGGAPGQPAEPRDPGVFAVYGVGVDDAHDTVWVTNTRQNTIAVYSQKDLSLVKQFEPGAVPHSRDVLIDAKLGRAYASSAMNNQIMVFDTKTLELVETYTINSRERGGKFGVMSLALDVEGGKLYTVSMNTAEAARIDLASGKIDILKVPGAVRGSGIAVDPELNRILIGSQGSDDLIALDGSSDSVVYDRPVGAGTLNVTYDAVSGNAFVLNRGSDSITVVEAATGEIVANLDAGSYPNYATVTADGVVYAVNKARGQDDSEGDQIWRIVPKK